MAKKKWLKEGDQNSKFFHVAINAHQNKTLISSKRMQDGLVLDSPKAVYEGLVHYFSKVLFDSQDRDIPNLRHLLSLMRN